MTGLWVSLTVCGAKAGTLPEHGTDGSVAETRPVGRKVGSEGRMRIYCSTSGDSEVKICITSSNS
jgi:hypothetical protein